MRAPAVSFAKRFTAVLMTALLTFTLLPANAFAEGEGGAVDAPTEESQAMSISQADEAAEVSTEADGSTSSAASSAEAETLAASLMVKPVSFVNVDVTLDGEPVVGSFTVDGLTFAVTEGSDVELVGAAGAEGAFSSEAPTSPQSPSASTTEAEALPLMLPESVTYNDVEYSVTSIGAYAFYLSGVTSVELPATVTDVDDRAFRSSDVASVTVVEGNSAYSSFDGALYDTDQLSLLLIPEGKQGTVLLPKTAESAPPSVFSHCPLVTQVSVEEGSAAFASENGLLYDASLTTLLRVPAGATEITIREDCTTIAAGAMEACVSLEHINAPASVTSISPDVFTSVPTVSLPAAALAEGASQLSALIALNSTDDDLPEIDPAEISVIVSSDVLEGVWSTYGFSVLRVDESLSDESLAASSAYGQSFITQAFIRDTSGKPSNVIAQITKVAPWSDDFSMTSGTFITYPLADGEWTRIHNYTNRIDWGYSSEIGLWSYVVGIGDYYTFWYEQPGVPLKGLAENGTLIDETWMKSGADFTYFEFCSEFDISFDVDSEPADDDCSGDVKLDEAVSNIQVGAGDKLEVEDPKRPGYVFQGWVIPSEDGTAAIDQDLVYQDEADGKWYVDASKLPDYATDGRVELTARWTSVISVDVPSAVTFYADVVTQGNESREGAASSAFGQSKVASQSEVDLRIVGLESSAVETQGSALGADSILKKASSATPSSSTQKLFSLYPTDEALTADKLQDPGAVSATKPADAVDFALDDILLEKSFAASKFTIPAGDTLNLGYRLNLSETGTELDYDKLSTLDEGQSASIANISYTFAKDALPVFWTFDDEGNMITLNRIKADARAIAEGDEALAAKYEDWLRADHRFYLRMFDKGVDEADAHDEEDSLVYPLRLIGVRHDKKAGTQEKAGLTFGFVNLLKDMYVMSTQGTNNAGWYQSHMRRAMNTTDGAILARFPSDVVACLESVEKPYVYAASQTNTNCLQSNDRVFLLSFAEVYGANDSGWYTDCAWLDKEGSQYAYYAMVNRGYGASKDNPLLKQRRLLADGTVSSACDRWWLRTPVPNGTSYVLMNNVGRDFMYYAGANNSTGVLPCFAF